MDTESSGLHRHLGQASIAIVAAIGLSSLGCLTPGQTYNVGQQLDDIRRQAEQVRTAQQGNAESIAALKTVEARPRAESRRAPEAVQNDDDVVREANLEEAASGPDDRREDSGWSDRSPDEGLFRQGYALYHRRDYQGAELLLRRFLSADPEGAMADDALFWIAECRFARGLYRDAIFEYRDLIERYPDSHRVPRAWYMAALCYERLGETEAMKDHLAIVVERFPDSDVAPLARDRLGNL